MLRRLLLSIVVLSCSGIAVVSAQGAPTDLLTAFRNVIALHDLAIALPTVVEVPLDDEFIERATFAVFNTTQRRFEPYLFLEDTQAIPVMIAVAGASDGMTNMIDGDAGTFAEFALPEDAQGSVRIMLTSAQPITSSSLSLALDSFVALPTSVEIRSLTDAGEKIVVATTRMHEPTIRFPNNTASSWIITFTYGQPLRIAELRLAQENAAVTQSQSLRFLAQPAQKYELYFDADRPVAVPTGEAPDLRSNDNVLLIEPLPSRKNPAYAIADTDDDGIPDITDNCVRARNEDQVDANGNGRGDACDDFDKDGVINDQDNCINEPNRSQADMDSDGIGDACDGEESRVTERYTWIPWAGMGTAAAVLIGLIALTLKPKKARQG